MDWKRQKNIFSSRLQKFRSQLSGRVGRKGQHRKEAYQELFAHLTLN